MASNGRAATHADTPLTDYDKDLIFCAATFGLLKRHGHQFVTGMTDDELRQALAVAGALADRVFPSKGLV